jgi:hypothetical protein
MLALHIFKINTTSADNKGLNRFRPPFHGKHALEVVANATGPTSAERRYDIVRKLLGEDL